MTDPEVRAAAAALLQDAIAAGRLSADPRPETLATVAGIIRPILQTKTAPTTLGGRAVQEVSRVSGTTSTPE